MDNIERQAIQAYVMPEMPLLPSDLALVFGTRHGIGEFARDVHTLWKCGYFKKVIISGGSTLGIEKSEASILRDLVCQLGVAPDDIMIEERATNTMENVIFARQLAECKLVERVGSVLAIGKISSARRYLMTLKRHWPDVERSIFPVNYFSVDKGNWWLDDDFRERVLREWKKIPIYIERGFITEI